MTIDWREELKKMEQEKAILDKAFEDGTLCWYREPWESWEEEYSEEDLQEVVHDLWEEEPEPERERYYESWWDHYAW